MLGQWLGYKEAKGAPTELDTDKLKAGLQKVLLEVEKLRPAGRGDGEELGLTIEEMIKESGLDEKPFHEVYLSWVEGAHPCDSRPTWVHADGARLQSRRRTSRYTSARNTSSRRLSG